GVAAHRRGWLRRAGGAGPPPPQRAAAAGAAPAGLLVRDVRRRAVEAAGAFGLLERHRNLCRHARARRLAEIVERIVADQGPPFAPALLAAGDHPELLRLWRVVCAHCGEHTVALIELDRGRARQLERVAAAVERDAGRDGGGPP